MSVSGPDHGLYHIHISQITASCSYGEGYLSLTKTDGSCTHGCFSGRHVLLPGGVGVVDSETGLAPGNYQVKWDGYCLHGGAVDGNITYSIDGGTPVQITQPECHDPSGSCDVRFSFPCGHGVSDELSVKFTISGCTTHDTTIQVTPECGEDTSCNRSCPMCVGAPVNVGSGNVKVTTPLFTIAEPARPLAFGLTYDSVAHTNESFIDRPVGAGWTHSFNMQMRPINSTRLLYVAPDGEVRFFDNFTGGSVWNAALPATSTDTVTLSGSEYVLQTLNGDTTRFNATTGHWTSMADRYGNTFTATYDTLGELIGITDPLGRTTTLTYYGTKLDTVVLWDNSTTWSFHYSGATLTGISDPLHGSANWRSCSYTTDHYGVVRLLTAVTDDSGAVLEGHAYDAQDRGTTSVSEGGRDSFTIEYDQPVYGQSRVTETRGSISQISVYSTRYIGGVFYPAKIDGVCSSCGGTNDSQTFTYDVFGRVLSRTDGEGHTTTYTYDANGNVSSMTEASGTPLARTTLYDHTFAADPTFVTQVGVPSVTGSFNKVTANTFNSDETLLTTSVTGREPADPSTPITYTSTTSFDSRHRVLQTHGPRTDMATITTRAYYSDTDTNLNRRGRPQSMTDPVGLTTTFDDYDVFGTPRTVTDPNGVITNRVTDARGRVTSEINRAVTGDVNESADYTRTIAYDSRDRLAQITSARNLVTQFAYEAGTNRLTDTTQVDGSGSQRERRHLTLDASGHVLQDESQVCTTPATTCTTWTTVRTVSNVYDQKGRLSEVDNPGNANLFYAYDLDGKVSSLQDENHSAPNTTYSYDALERLTTVSQKLGTSTVVTQYGYDVQNNVTSVTDPNGNVTTYSFDDFGRPRVQSSPVAGSTGYSYDPAGNLTASSDADSAWTQRTYDAANRLLTETSRFGPAGLPHVVQWTYDDSASGHYGKGRLASMSDPTGTTTYQYDRRGLTRIEQKTSPPALPNLGIPANPWTLNFGYDADGNRTSLQYPSGSTAVYTYDFAGRPLTLTFGGNSIISSAKYLPGGPQTELSFGNGTTKTTPYDQRYFPLENKLALGTAVIADYNYSTDKVGNITGIADAVASEYSRTFGYDDLNRLVTANTGSALWRTGSYTYDAMGNMLTRFLGGAITAPPVDDPEQTPSVTPARATEFTYDGTTPKVIGVTENGLLRGVTYDAAGNEKSYVATRTYLPRGNLLYRIEDDGEGVDHHVVTYQYDGRRLRVVRTEGPVEDPNGIEAKRTFVYSPELQLLSVTVDDRPNLWGKRAISHDVFVPRYELLYFAGKPVAQIAGGTGAIRYTFTDHLGTPLLQTEASAQIVWRAEYEPFGNVWSMRAGTALGENDPSGAVEQPLRFPGQEVATRWEGSEENYNVFRWYRSGWGRYTQADPLGLAGSSNLFGYVDENPLSFSDPLGLISPVHPTRQRWRMCNGDETSRCQASCRYGMESCRVSQTFRVVRARNGMIVHAWVDGPMSCSCKEPDCLDRLRDWARRWLPDDPRPLPPLIPLPPFEPPMTPEPAIPGLPPFFINPCVLNPGMPGCGSPGFPGIA